MNDGLAGAEICYCVNIVVAYNRSCCFESLNSIEDIPYCKSTECFSFRKLEYKKFILVMGVTLCTVYFEVFACIFESLLSEQ